VAKAKSRRAAIQAGAAIAPTELLAQGRHAAEPPAAAEQFAGTMRVLPRPTFADDGKNTIASQLVERLREAIVSGQLEAGSKINLERTRETFDVSLSPLREALARLISEGLVLFEDNRGYQVAPLSLENLEEITRLREEFETMALRQAMVVGDIDWEGDIMRSLHRLNRIERDASRPETLEQWERHHRDFHLSLISACRMPVLLGFCGVLLNLNDRYRRTFPAARSGDREVSAEHSEIAAATVARDMDLACQRLRDHLHRTGTNLRRHLAAAVNRCPGGKR
jgi:DNA-binding GntR family transcriptional regulator